MTHMRVQTLWSGWRETLRAFSPISLKVLTQCYVCPPTGRRGQSAHYKQLWMKYEAFLITLGIQRGCYLVSSSRWCTRWAPSHQQQTAANYKVTFPPAIYLPVHQRHLIRFHHQIYMLRCWVFPPRVVQHFNPPVLWNFFSAVFILSSW